MKTGELTSLKSEQTIISTLIEAGCNADSAPREKCRNELPMNAFLDTRLRNIYRIIINSDELLETNSIWREIEKNGLTGLIDYQYLLSLVGLVTGSAHLDYYVRDLNQCLENRKTGQIDQPVLPLNMALEEMNEKHAIVMVGGKCCVLNETFDPVFNRPDFSLSNPHDLKNFYKNTRAIIKKQKETVEVSPVDHWLKWPLRRTYKGIIFSPDKNKTPDYYNLFRGLPIEPKKGKWNYFQDHIHEVIANGVPDVTNYLISWMAYKLQNLGKKRCHVAIVLRGERGAGKGCFATNYGKVFGNHFVHIMNQGHITGRFNSVLKDALMVYIDEAFWAGDKQAEGILKGLITEDTINIEYKGKDIFRVKNHTDYLMASNNDWVIPAGFKERRFCVLDVSNSKIGNKAWFEKVFHQMDNGGLQAVLYDLMRWDLSRFDPRDFPKTEALVHQMLVSMSPTRKFWFSMIQEGTLTGNSDKATIIYDFGGWVSTKDLHELYLDYASKLKIRHPDTDNVFIKELKHICPGMRASKKTTHKGRITGHQIPPLEECREDFEQISSMPIKWDGEENI